MATIILVGWREGFQKIALTNLQRELLQLPLKEAKANVDQLLEAEENRVPPNPMALEVPDAVAVEFFNRASDLGVHLRFLVVKSHQQHLAGPPEFDALRAA